MSLSAAARTAPVHASAGVRVCSDCLTVVGPSPTAFLLSIGGFVMSSFMLPLSIFVMALGFVYILLGLFIMHVPALVIGIAMLPTGRIMMSASCQGLRLRLQRGMHYCAPRSGLVREPADLWVRLLSLAVLGAGTWALGALAARSWLLSHFEIDVLAACLSPLWALLSLLYARTLLGVLRGGF